MSKILMKKKPKAITFGELSAGDMFVFGKKIYVKLRNIGEALCLDNRDIYFFYLTDRVVTFKKISVEV